MNTFIWHLYLYIPLVISVIRSFVVCSGPSSVTAACILECWVDSAIQQNISAVYMLNKVGPRTNPYSTPAVILVLNSGKIENYQFVNNIFMPNLVKRLRNTVKWCYRVLISFKTINYEFSQCDELVRTILKPNPKLELYDIWFCKSV